MTLEEMEGNTVTKRVTKNKNGESVFSFRVGKEVRTE